jgi:hypothetical protein
MVNVKLVENRVKRNVGIVIVVKVITQYRIPGITLMKNKAILPNTPSREPGASTSVWFDMLVATATAEAIVDSMELMELWAREDIV